MAAAKKNLSATTPNASASALVHPGGADGGVRTSLDSEQHNVCKKRLKNFLTKTARLSQTAAALRPGICSKMARGPGHHGRTSCKEHLAIRFYRGQAGLC
jgi:hypothetical protein